MAWLSCIDGSSSAEAQVRLAHREVGGWMAGAAPGPALRRGGGAA